MCLEGGFFFKFSKRDFTFIREMRVLILVGNFQNLSTLQLTGSWNPTTAKRDKLELWL